MLINPSFEDPYRPVSYDNMIVASGWQPIYNEGGLPPQEHSQGPCVRPEYKPVYKHQYDYRVIDGAVAQCFFVFRNVMDAGLTQRIDVPVNAKVRFTCNVQAWCSNKDATDPDKLPVSDGEMYVRLGVDLEGRPPPMYGQDPFYSDIVWTDWRLVRSNYELLSISAVTLTPYLTLYIRAWNKWRLKHNDVYVDAATFEVSGGNGGGGLTEDQVRAIAREEAQKVYQEQLDAIIQCLSTRS